MFILAKEIAMKKDLIDILREEADSEHVAFTNFTLKYKNECDKLYCFFEGEDDKKYYSFRIKHITERDFFEFPCGGKEQVIKAYNLINSKKEYKISKILFFIDKDFDGEKVYSNPQIYTTPCYSIENFYTSKKAMCNILKDEFSLQEDDSDFSLVIDIYENLQSKFHSETLILNSWLACQSDKRTNSKLQSRLKIDNCTNDMFKKIVKSDLKSIYEFPQISSHKKIEENVFVKASKVSSDDLSNKIIFFDTKNKQQLFRGKFEIKFLASFLNKLQTEIGNNSSQLFSNVHNCNLRFEVDNILSVLTQYADTPECLMKYLKRYNKNLTITSTTDAVTACDSYHSLPAAPVM